MRDLPGAPARAAFTLLETLVAASVGLVVVGGLVSASIAIQRSISATKHYVAAVNNGDRLIDSVAQDIRRAVRVGVLVGTANTPLKNNISFGITDTSTLAINIPDYYGSNVPYNGFSASYKRSRYARSTLNTEPLFNSYEAGSPLNGCIPWNDAVTTVGALQMPRFAPAAASSDEVQVRYFRRRRSAFDPTLCFFRAEYSIGATLPNSAPREIAERVADDVSLTSLVVTAANLPITDPAYGRSFTIQSSFKPKYGKPTAAIAPTIQQVSVLMRNPRRD